MENRKCWQLRSGLWCFWFDRIFAKWNWLWVNTMCDMGLVSCHMSLLEMSVFWVRACQHLSFSFSSFQTNPLSSKPFLSTVCYQRLITTWPTKGQPLIQGVGKPSRGSFLTNPSTSRSKWYVMKHGICIIYPLNPFVSQILETLNKLIFSFSISLSWLCLPILTLCYYTSLF